MPASGACHHWGPGKMSVRYRSWPCMNAMTHLLPLTDMGFCTYRARPGRPDTEHLEGPPAVPAALARNHDASPEVKFAFTSPLLAAARVGERPAGAHGARMSPVLPTSSQLRPSCSGKLRG